MPTNYTLTYSEISKGWPSFYSYFPDFIVGMNQYLYTFNGGSLYRHNTGAIRNRYYGIDYYSEITGVFNQEPTTTKVFKTIELQSDSSWSCSVNSNLDNGNITSGDFELKEGSYFSYIRGTGINLASRSTQGIGYAVSTTGASPGTITLTFNFAMGSIISINDIAIFVTPTSAPAIGPITAISEDRKTLTVNAVDLLPIGTVVPANSYILYTKNAAAESYGMLGYYLQFTLTNSSSQAVELFSIDSDVFKSFP
jgi:hypothetical protein